MTRQTDTDWIAEGAQVAEVVRSHNLGVSGVYPTTIDRIANTWIYLANGNRYNRKTLAPAKGNTGTGNAPSVELLPIDHPEVRRSLALEQLDKVAMVASRAYRSGASSADDVLSALDEIERAVRAARQAITGKEA